MISKRCNVTMILDLYCITQFIIITTSPSGQEPAVNPKTPVCQEQPITKSHKWAMNHHWFILNHVKLLGSFKEVYFACCSRVKKHNYYHRTHKFLILLLLCRIVQL